MVNPDPEKRLFSQDMDPRIQIHIKILLIQNTDFDYKYHLIPKLQNSLLWPPITHVVRNGSSVNLQYSLSDQYDSFFHDMALFQTILLTIYEDDIFLFFYYLLIFFGFKASAIVSLGKHIPFSRTKVF